MVYTFCIFLSHVEEYDGILVLFQLKMKSSFGVSKRWVLCTSRIWGFLPLICNLRPWLLGGSRKWESGCRSSMIHQMHPPKSFQSVIYPLVMTNIAMENGTFIDVFPIKTSIYTGFSMAMSNNQRVPWTLWQNSFLQTWETHWELWVPMGHIFHRGASPRCGWIMLRSEGSHFGVYLIDKPMLTIYHLVI